MGYGFSSLHPLPLFLYYIGAIGLIVTFYHPIFLLISLVILTLINYIQDRGRALKSYLKFYTFILIAILFINPIISNRGETILFYIGYRGITLESLVYGLCTGLSLISIMVLFLSYNMAIGNDKFMYLFSNLLPKTSFLIMMTLRFIPLLRRRLKEVNMVQKLKGGEDKPKGFKDKLTNSMKTLNILVTWSLEESIITARSMRSRGYGLRKNRSFYFNYKMGKFDTFFLFIIILLGLSLILSWTFGLIGYNIYPKLSPLVLDLQTVFFLILFSLYMGIPIIIEGIDKRKWHK